MMNRIFLLCLCLVLTLKLTAQKFEEVRNQPLVSGLMYEHAEWVDLDNNGLLDVLLMAEDGSNLFIVVYENDTTNGFIWKGSINTQFSNAVYTLSDIDLDNHIDIILSGIESGQPATVVFLSNGDFTFQPGQSLVNLSASILRFADLNEDGRKEMIISGRESGDAFFKVFQNRPAGWELVSDSIDLEASVIEPYDFDGDTKVDLLISGKRDDNSGYTAVLYNENNFYFNSAYEISAQTGEPGIGDLNGDGRADIVMQSADGIIRKLLGSDDGFAEEEFDVAVENADLFTGDFNSDGTADISLLGNLAGGDRINLVYHPDGDFDTLNIDNLVLQRFGDVDHDGDLDVLQVVNAGTFSLKLFENLTVEENLPPFAPSNAAGFNFFKRLFLYWEKPGDDHTIPASLTYDVTIQSANEEIVIGGYDLINTYRLMVSHGNQGNNNYLLFKHIPNGSYNYQIQAVDNAYHAGPRPGSGSGGICNGSTLACSEFLVSELEVCENEEVILSASSVNALWFSFSEGFLGTSDHLSFQSAATDTVFSFTPQQGAGCSVLQLYTVTVRDDLAKVETSERYVCEGNTIEFSVEAGWEQVEWSSDLNGIISNDNSISYTVAGADTVSVYLANEAGCNILRKTALKISKPEIVLENEAYQILKGESVQLGVSGGVNYLWQPAAGLNKNNVPDPVASPANTTTYVVTVTDSIGCTAQANVLVVVEFTAFIPNLFTPNADNKNDELKIYGMGSAKNFTFTIYNREGSLVYESKDVGDVTARGWDGTVRGVQQPGGIYYWKVTGETSNGGKVKLNGKSSGSIVLIR